MSYVNYFDGQPVSDGWAEHRARGSLGGIDYAVGVGTPIRATCDGRVQNIPNNGTGGHTVTFWHTNGLGDGYRDQFMHLSQFVAEGNYKQGDVIGYSGGRAGSDGAGSSTGPHCHWHLINPSGTRVNPLEFVGSPSSSSGSSYSNEMRGIQEIMAAQGLYNGIIDGVFGPKSWRAVQTWLQRYGMYDGAIDGIPGPKTYAGFQAYGAKNGNYTGPKDGVLGPRSWAGFLQTLKEDTAPAPTPVPAPEPLPVAEPTPSVSPTPAPEAKPQPQPVVEIKPDNPVVITPTKPTKPVKEPKVSKINPLPEDAKNAANDALGILIPKAKNRKLAYAIYGLVALVISNVSVGVMASGTQAPAWLIIASAVVGNLAVPFTTLAIANAGNSSK